MKRTSDYEGNELKREDFVYDAAGNISSDGKNKFAYDANNRLMTYNCNPAGYDKDGNMLSARLSGTNTAFEYDSANRLIKAGDHTYTYNAEDVRIRNVRDGYDTTYTYNTNARLSQLLVKTTNGVETKYVYGLGLIGEEKCGEFKTYHFDFRGSTVAITDTCGNITDTFKYDTYGKLISRTGNSFVILGYNGRDGVVTDRNGLLYMRARYYSPEMRRFVNADIISGEISDSTSLNRYSYVNGNPASLVDPFGLAAEERAGEQKKEKFNLIDWIIDFHKNDTHKIGGKFKKGLLLFKGAVSGGNSELGFSFDDYEWIFSESEGLDLKGFWGVIADLSFANANGEVRFGNEDISITLSGNLDLLNLEAQAGVQYEKGFGFNAGAGASVAEGEVTIKVEIYGVEIEYSVSAEALSAKASASAGFVRENGKTKLSFDKSFGGGYFGAGSDLGITLPF